MSNNVKSVKSLPNYEKEVTYFDKDGKTLKKKVKVPDVYLVTFDNGNAIAIDAEEIKRLDLKVELPAKGGVTNVTEKKSEEDDE